MLLAAASANARDIRVGTDAKTIAEGIRIAQPGDTIHLEPKVYRDYAGFYGKKGEAGKPITLDGHGATLEGSDPIDPAKWREVSPGLFANDELLPPRNLDDAVIGRWFFLWDGKMNLMGRTSKGRSAPFKKAEELQPGEWTFVKGPLHADAKPQQIFGTFFLKLPAGQKLADAHIAAPMRSAGVQMSGDNAHLVIRNLTATHPYNDGFNIHGDCRDVVFENIRALECGDDGISAHESAEYRVDGFVSIGNSTGITDTVAAHTSYNRVFIADCHGFDLFFLDDGRYRLTNSVVLSSAQNPFALTGRDDKRAELVMENVLIRRIGPAKNAEVARTASLDAKRVTFENLELTARGDVKFENCIINGKPMPEGSPAVGADRARLIGELVPAEYRKQFALP